MKRYIVGANDEKGDNYVTLHAKYMTYQDPSLSLPSLPSPPPLPRKMAYKTFFRYMKALHPDYTFSKKKEDECDICIRLKTSLLDANIGDEEREALKVEQREHWYAARTQRVAMKEAINNWARKSLENHPIGSIEKFDNCLDRLPEFLEDAESSWNDVPSQDDEHPYVLLQAEDYGGNLLLPWYGKNRPSKDYYASNLNLYMFVIANFTTGKNHVYLYDERAMGKNDDALCSLRFSYYLNRLKMYKDRGCLLNMPDTLFLIMDNCVGQNKSQVVFKFFCFLSLTFFKRVACQFLITGHFHMAPDRVTSNAKSAIGIQDLYLPTQIAEAMNNVANIQAEFLDHSIDDNPFFTGWSDVMNAHFASIPNIADGGYTKNHFFEFLKEQSLYVN